jgi:deoxyuridine 5'-triphosphate nucleotidohydrolase
MTTIPHFHDVIDTQENDSCTKVRVKCNYQVDKDCKKEHVRKFCDVLKNLQRNDNVYVCMKCSNNPSRKCMYEYTDDFMCNIDTERKACLLGLIASECVFSKLDIPKEVFTGALPHLSINPEEKDRSVCFPKLNDNQLYWDFLRGYFDNRGSICHNSCSMTTTTVMLDSIHKFCQIPSHISKNRIEWTGVNALDFLGRLYQNANIYRQDKYNAFLSMTVPTNVPRKLPSFKWARTCEEAIPPQKDRFTDSGYDLHIVKKSKVKKNVHYYDTGIKIQPESGYYFDLVGRSSISKSGWTLANNVGIIDAGYTGSILVALVRTDPDAPEPELPFRLVQIIPRQLILMEATEVDSFDETNRGGGGFGSSDKETKK